MPPPDTPLLVPSLLAGDHAALGQSVAAIEDAGLAWVHLDIMDAHFVPNLSFGPQTLAALRPRTSLYFDTHLMLAQPHLYIETFARAGAQNITVHVEPDYGHLDALRKIKALGLNAGLALNPDTPVEKIRPFLAEVDLILAMTVHPGFGGQVFMDEMLGKVRTLARWRREAGLRYRIEVDGGITLESGQACRIAGADTLVAGTSFFDATDRRKFADDATSGILQK